MTSTGDAVMAGKPIGTALDLTDVVVSVRTSAVALTDRIRDIADGVNRFCLVTNL
jgi:multisubunit Na+/H+ antiporter MnhC subunit